MDMDGMNMGQSNSTSAEMMSTFFTTSFVCVSLFPAFLPSPSQLTIVYLASEHQIYGSAHGRQQRQARHSEHVQDYSFSQFFLDSSLPSKLAQKSHGLNLYGIEIVLLSLPLQLPLQMTTKPFHQILLNFLRSFLPSLLLLPALLDLHFPSLLHSTSRLTSLAQSCSACNPSQRIC